MNSPWFSFSSVCEPVVFKPFKLLGGNSYHHLQHTYPPLPPASSLLLQLGVRSHHSVPCSSSAKGSMGTVPSSRGAGRRKDCRGGSSSSSGFVDTCFSLQLSAWHLTRCFRVSCKVHLSAAASAWRISLLCATQSQVKTLQHV